MSRWGLLLALVVVVGCKKPEIAAVTTAPAGRTAEIDGTTGGVRVTRGLAVALSCSKAGAPCTGMKVTTAADNIASAYLSATDELYSGGYVASTATTAPDELIVVTGNATGNTTVNVEIDLGTVAIDVEVIDP